MRHVPSTTHTRLQRCMALWMRRTVLVSLSALLLEASSQAFAQARFEDLALRINLNDQLRIKDQSGGKAAGYLTHLTCDEIVIRTHSGESRFNRATVSEVAVRGYELGKSAFIGAGLFALLGAVTMHAHDEENWAIIGTLGAAPIGAGLGLTIGALFPRVKPVYRVSKDGGSVPPSLGGDQAGFLADLALRINLDDKIQVESASGDRTSGRVTRLTADEITVHTDAGEKQFARETVRQITVRRRSIRRTVLVGAGAGALVGAVAACTSPNREECIDATIMSGALGAGLGFIAGALMHTTTIVYPEADRHTSVSPVISRDLIAIRIGRQW